MSKLDGRLKAIIAYIHKLMASRALEPDQKKALINSIGALRKALKRQNRKALEKAIANLVKVFLKEVN